MTEPTKAPFDIEAVMQKVEQAVRPFPKAAMFELFERGFRSPFEQLVACMISIRTWDEQTLVIAPRLFAQARTPQEMVGLSVDEIDRLISPCTFHARKAEQIRQLARRVLEEFGGELPCDAETMRQFAGVGLKCANLAAGIGCGQMRVSADIHVHRVTNRWGYVTTHAPEQTSRSLEAQLPLRYWIEINRLLVPFGKHICTGERPKCSTCPVIAMCRQVGVGQHR
jgi:endonuclease-3